MHSNHHSQNRADTSRIFLSNIRDRFFDSQNYPPQNPYESPAAGNFYPYQPGYEMEQSTPSFGNGRYGQATYHQHVYSTVGGGGGGHKSKNSGLAMSGLTLLAFLFFIQMLQSCLKEQMTSMNPTVMVMTAGTRGIRKSAASGSASDTNKELNHNDHNDNHESEAIISSVSNHVDMLTNDQGDVFYGPAPKISFKLDNSFVARSIDSHSDNPRERT